MNVGKLSAVHSIARARATESFEYFANTVLSARLEPEFCDAVQKSIERGEVLAFPPFQGRAVRAWLSAIGREEKLPSAPTATFAWLFDDRVA